MAVDSPRPWFPQAVDRRAVPAGLDPTLSQRVPTGVPDFDFLTGGIPAGSVVLLLGEAGAGGPEFALTSAAHLMLHYDDPEMHRFFLGSARGPFVYPKGIAYLSTSRSEEQLLREIEGSFEPGYLETLRGHLTFRDLSPAYFADSIVPTSWAAVERPLLAPATGLAGREDGPLGALAGALDESGPANLVIVDSRTDLGVRRGVDGESILTLLKGLRRRAKAWGGIVYLLLTRGVAPSATEQAIVDSVDGVLSFSWAISPSRSHRQRTMVIDRFMPVLAHIPHEHQGRFVIRINALDGLVTTQYERV